jgi:hypothetical protein
VTCFKRPLPDDTAGMQTGLLITIQKYEGKWTQLQEKDIANIYAIEWYYKDEQRKFTYSKHDLKYKISYNGWKHHTA